MEAIIIIVIIMIIYNNCNISIYNYNISERRASGDMLIPMLIRMMIMIRNKGVRGMGSR